MCEAVVDDALKDRIDRAGVVHSVKMGVLVHNDHHLLGQGIEVGKYILQGAKGKGHRENFYANQFLYKTVDIFLHGPFQALEVYSLIGALLESFQNECGLSYPPLAIDHHSLADMFMLQESEFFLSTNKHLLYLSTLLKWNSVNLRSRTL